MNNAELQCGQNWSSLIGQYTVYNSFKQYSHLLSRDSVGEKYLVNQFSIPITVLGQFALLAFDKLEFATFARENKQIAFLGADAAITIYCFADLSNVGNIINECAAMAVSSIAMSSCRHTGEKKEDLWFRKITLDPAVLLVYCFLFLTSRGIGFFI